MLPRPATIQDVARLSGVSTATVSRALSHPERVSVATRELVLSAVAATGYQANQAARNLRRKRSGAILALVPNMANPFFSEILSGLGAALAERGNVLLIADTQTAPAGEAGTAQDASERLSHYLSTGKADGAVLFDANLSLSGLPLGPKPPILMACEWKGAGIASVHVDNAGGAALAVTHLLDAGHRRFGYLAGPQGNVLSQSRLEGMRAQLREAGLNLPDAHIFQGDFGLAAGEAAAKRWLALSERPTAIFSASDEMAIGFISCLTRAGVRVPKEVSVVGFDDIEVARYLDPALTTIRQPRRLIGERAAERILAMLEGTSEAAGAQSECLAVELVSRASVAPPVAG